tara:strand:+ start:902 stop:2356 length:1455 start_codon:yes stop_codon:yes gene_type:complete
MKKVLFLLLLLSNFVQAQAPMDGPFVSERFQIYNGLVNYKVWGIGDFLMMNADAFKLEAKDVNFLNEKNLSQFEANYLFQEENYWIKRLYRTIIFNDHDSNKGLEYIELANGKTTFIEYLRKAVNNPHLSFYKNSAFNIALLGKKIAPELFDQIIGIQFKEDFAYNRVTNKLEIYISGVAPIIKHGSGHLPIFWLSFKNLKGELDAEGAKSVLMNRLVERRFKASVDEEENIVMNGIIDHSYQTDLDALVTLKLLEEKIAITPEVYRKEGSFKINVGGVTIKGEVLKGKLQGEVILKEEGKGIILSVEFKSGMPNGKYTAFYSKGKVKHTGAFSNGLRVGVWLGYFDNGKKSTEKKYDNGFLEGDQKIFFDNGTLRNVYSFENGKLSGSFKEFYSNGKIKQEGRVVNGLLTGDWKYNIKLSPEIIKMIMRNPSLWDEKFKVVPQWKSASLSKGVLSFVGRYEFETSDRCLSSICPKLTIVNTEK